jgi:transposase InsO family protein
MQLHANAALSLIGRRQMVSRVVEHGWSIAAAAAAAQTSSKTCGKWVSRYREQGECGLLDHSSAPREIPHRTAPEREQLIAQLRRLRMTGAEIAFVLRMPLSTVSAVLLRIGLGKLSRLEPPEPPNRYERARPGELIHVDVKKLGRIAGGAGHRAHGQRSLQPARRREGKRQTGWEFVHVCIDDATRIAYVEVLSDEKAATAVAFLGRALEFYRRHGIRVERVMTDNGSAYRSTVHALACRLHGIRHLRTRPYRPRTNGKAERFIRTLIGGWAYGPIYATSRERTQALDGWLWSYNHRRPHGSLSHKTPITRLNELNNPPGSYS